MHIYVFFRVDHYYSQITHFYEFHKIFREMTEFFILRKGKISYFAKWRYFVIHEMERFSKSHKIVRNFGSKSLKKYILCEIPILPIYITVIFCFICLRSIYGVELYALNSDTYPKYRIF